MAAYSNYALRVPASLMDDLRIASMRDGVSMNGFIVQALAKKMAVLRERGMLPDLSAAEQATYLAARTDRSRDGRFAEILGKAGTTTGILPGDKIPEGWLDGPGATEEPTGALPRMGR